MRELHDDASTHTLSHHVNGRNLQPIEQSPEVLGKALQRPAIVRWRNRRAPETPQVRPQHPKLSGQTWHPGKPGLARISNTMHEQNGFRGGPGIGKIVEFVVQIEGFIDTQRWHAILTNQVDGRYKFLTASSIISSSSTAFLFSISVRCARMTPHESPW